LAEDCVKLDKPFENIGELYRQWRRFNDICFEEPPPFNRSSKRKRSQFSDGEAVAVPPEVEIGAI